ncbi:MAG: imidazole glycerol phosphate synthase subunit HisH [Gammaproteobacteria bacterium]|jgi:glutamine amidotransferase|nr:imidazole glycerol phosphate synthase subunit HisH [Gammaproteobacteria bacterium]MBT3490241.1 imidazole glycerol phosphate synthase subunit HisH [Gammaproteobacteria bacterium]MBT3719834.1 imidazole glycerol phosphate synthase subunit HisH [Gammaproteobacteria bacterium]MBT3845682.1 imidazole glycerol phosphate synthase subunit HisH [Gammaproteobacteria bacterium]MBT3893121.1 imidazole glycerol phosphate synthase subunit HisH [Gammaproteobacteria bacterium]
MSTIAVIDYGMGNLRSVSKALEHVAPDLNVVVTDDVSVIRSAERIVFPGVGAMRDCMLELRNRSLVEIIKEVALDRPFLGVCLGMQLLLDYSEENEGTEGLSILPGEVKRFPKPLIDPESETQARLKIPHMGWNQVKQSDHPMWSQIEDQSRFYFVHSYYVVPDSDDEVAATSCYGFEFACALQRDNIFATQFHPEKSQHAGLQLLQNFTQWNGK